MMVKEIDEHMVRVIVLDISGIYVQIYDQGYFDKNTVDEIKQQYSDTKHWYIIIIE